MNITARLRRRNALWITLAPTVVEFEARGIDVLDGGFDRSEGATWNAVRQLTGERQTYHKRHLVPFGEYLPFRELLEVFSALVQIPGSDLTPVNGPNEPITVAGGSIGMSICYEDVFGEELRALVLESGVLVNVSNDVWFGISAAPPQHEQKARMRARELARPLIRVTNTGVSSSIAHDGMVEAPDSSIDRCRIFHMATDLNSTKSPTRTITRCDTASESTSVRNAERTTNVGMPFPADSAASTAPVVTR